jgi:hypothetical protein
MMDFTLAAYTQYINAIKKNYKAFSKFEDIITTPAKHESFCLIRHDVDRLPKHALIMARLENKMEIKSTYYFRAKPHTFKPNIIKEIFKLGHEIGYHYESLSDTNGDIKAAILDFEKNLEKFRKLVPVSTISMHGRPFKPYDNRDIWRIPENHKLLKEKFKILGEVYLDIDYSDIAYINDTGRNWTSGKNNLRDKVHSTVRVEFNNGKELLHYLSNDPHPRLVFQIHPERWSNNLLDWTSQYTKDKAVNIIRVLLNKIFSFNKLKQQN